MANELIFKMQNGDRSVIFDCLSHSGAIFRMNAAGNAAIHGMNDSETISRLVDLESDETFLDGFTVGDFATAALVVLGCEKYYGSSERIKLLIESRFDFLKPYEQAKFMSRNGSGDENQVYCCRKNEGISRGGNIGGILLSEPDAKTFDLH